MLFFDTSIQKQESSSDDHEDVGYEDESDSSVDVEDMSSCDGEAFGGRRLTRRSTRVQTRATKGRFAPWFKLAIFC